MINPIRAIITFFRGKKAAKVLPLQAWSKPFVLKGGHNIYELSAGGELSQIALTSDRVQHRGHNRYCIQMKRDCSYITALNTANARRQFQKRAISLLTDAIC